MTQSQQIGMICKRHRRRMGYTQKDVAQQTGYSTVNISSFETGRNNNMLILLWYISHSLPVSELRGVYDNGAKL